MDPPGRKKQIMVIVSWGSGRMLPDYDDEFILLEHTVANEWGGDVQCENTVRLWDCGSSRWEVFVSLRLFQRFALSLGHSEDEFLHNDRVTCRLVLCFSSDTSAALFLLGSVQ